MTMSSPTRARRSRRSTSWSRIGPKCSRKRAKRSRSASAASPPTPAQQVSPVLSFRGDRRTLHHAHVQATRPNHTPKPSADDRHPSSRRSCRPHRRSVGVRRAAARAQPVGSHRCLAVRRTDHRPFARDQYLPADLDDQVVLHQPQSEHVVFAAAFRRPGQLRRYPQRRRHLEPHADDGPVRRLDRRVGGRGRLRPGAPDQPAVPRPRILDHDHPAADDAVAGRGRQLLDPAVSAADRPVQLCASV